MLKNITTKRRRFIFFQSLPHIQPSLFIHSRFRLILSSFQAEFYSRFALRFSPFLTLSWKFFLLCRRHFSLVPTAVYILFLLLPQAPAGAPAGAAARAFLLLRAAPAGGVLIVKYPPKQIIIFRPLTIKSKEFTAQISIKPRQNYK